MSTTLSQEDGVSLQVDADCMLSAMLSTKASKEKIGKTFMTPTYMVMSRAVGVKKPQEAQKAKALWAMEAAKDKRRVYDLAR